MAGVLPMLGFMLVYLNNYKLLLLLLTLLLLLLSLLLFKHANMRGCVFNGGSSDDGGGSFLW